MHQLHILKLDTPCTKKASCALIKEGFLISLNKHYEENDDDLPADLDKVAGKEAVI